MARYGKDFKDRVIQVWAGHKSFVRKDGSDDDDDDSAEFSTMARAIPIR